MEVWTCCLFGVLVLLNSAVGEDTVAEDIGVHQLERLVELLTPTECEDLLSALSQPEEDIFKHLERLSPERSQLQLRHRAKRDTSTDSEAQCRSALTDWLQLYGEETYYDRLSRALQHIGRTDVAIEVGKNINQDKALNLKRYVEGYHNYVSSLKLESEKSAEGKAGKKKVRRRNVRDLTWRDLDLIVERAPVPPYQKGPSDVALPLLYGLLVGFGGTLLVGMSVVLLTVYIWNRREKIYRPRIVHGRSDVMDSEVLLGDDSSSGELEEVFVYK